jgi:UDP-N-acetylglucosamine--N-acetylmuramyl-(pentapeptide) pyrophosphoryl-undecaprenol N-acetylglucosamine transferase
MRVMIAGGGTGGHVYPGIAVYNALRRARAGVEALFVGTRAGVEHRIFAELGLPHVLLPGRGVRGKGLLTKLSSPIVFFVGLIRGILVILSFKPHVVIGTGGYASVAVVAASVVCRRKRVVQEQNSVPGLANRLLARFADLVLLSYEESRPFIKTGAPVAVTGNPIRIDKRADRSAGVAFLGLEPDPPTVLICGGSRGARTINRAARSAIPAIAGTRPAQFVFITGESDYDEVRSEMAALGRRVRVFAFLQEMQHAYSVADVAVSRAGASAVFELAAFGVPTVFVPYPFAADDHQKRNVAGLAELGAAVVVANDELDGDRLRGIVEALLDDPAGRSEMAGRMKAWAKPDADDLAAAKIIELASKRAGGPPRVAPASRVCA